MTNTAARQTGTVKWFNEQKGFGFILPDAGGADVFVHRDKVEAGGMRTLTEGQKVSFVVATFKGRNQAEDLQAA